MKLKLIAILAVLFFANNIQAQYYNGAIGKTGAPLFNSLHNIIQNASTIGYQNLWAQFANTDAKPNGKVWDIYSYVFTGTQPYEFTFSTNQCGTYSAEGDCYNREHTWPESYFGSTEPIRSDLQMIYPTDGSVNNTRSNYPYGVVNKVLKKTTKNGSKLGTSTSYTGYNGSTDYVFEPIDSFKGDLARVYFYMSTMYDGNSNFTNWQMSNGSVLTADAVALLLSWHHLDPVSQKEIDRNQTVYGIQGNRNPYIDYPAFVDCIWGTTDCTPMGISNTNKMKCAVYPNPATDVLHFMLDKNNNDNKTIHVINNLGQEIITNKSTENTIDISTIPNGFYVLQIEANTQVYYAHFVK